MGGISPQAAGHGDSTRPPPAEPDIARLVAVREKRRIEIIVPLPE
jgi:hypothetical protein